MDHPLPWLRYVDAADLDTGDLRLKGFDVKNVADEKLGELNGLIVDSAKGDPYYLVVDSKGWFKTKHFLIPIGHARLDATRGALVAELTEEQIRNYPGFDLDKFPQWSESDIERFNRDTAGACCADVSATAGSAGRWTARHHARPDWWDTRYYRPEHAGEAGMPPETWADRLTSQPDGEPSVAHDSHRK